MVDSELDPISLPENDLGAIVLFCPSGPRRPRLRFRLAIWSTIRVFGKNPPLFPFSADRCGNPLTSGAQLSNRRQVVSEIRGSRRVLRTSLRMAAVPNGTKLRVFSVLIAVTDFFIQFSGCG